MFNEKEIDVFVNLIRKYKKFKDIPKEYLNRNICEYFLLRNDKNFKYIPKEIMTKEFCIEMLYKNLSDPRDVPEEYMSSEVYFNLVKNGLLTFEGIPQKFLTREICLYFNKIKNIPKEFLDDDYYQKIFNKNPEVIKNIPKENQTLEMIKNFLIYPYFSLWRNETNDFLNEDLMSKIKYKLFFYSVGINYEKIKIIPNKYKNSKICKTALIESNFMRDIFVYIPKNLITFKFIIYKRMHEKHNKFFKFISFNHIIKFEKNVSYYYF
jgi:hypothetical protein